MRRLTWSASLVTAQQKRLIVEAIDNYLKERIELADQVICSFATEKIKDGDTIVTYARW
jgi:translation initiation factor eIF-2B subunit delta